MFVLNILWTTDLFEEKNILSPKMIGYSIANELFLAGVDISFVCSSETSSAALTASLLSNELQLLQKNKENTIYVFPYINCPYTIQYQLANKLDIKNMKFLKQSSNFPFFYKNYSNFKHFETYIIPFIKKLLWTTHHLYKKNIDNTDNIDNSYNVLIVSHPYFIEDTFGISIKKGETVTQTYTYQNYTDDTPISVECHKPILCHKWHRRSVSSPNFEHYRKIFLVPSFTL